MLSKADRDWNFDVIPDYKVYGDKMGPIWGRQDPGGPDVGPMNLAIWDISVLPRTRMKVWEAVMYWSLLTPSGRDKMDAISHFLEWKCLNSG